MTDSTLTDRELGVLHRLDLLDVEHHRCAVAPEHEADVWVGALWEALGVCWAPKDLYVEWSRGEQQQTSRARLRLQELKLVGRPPQDAKVLGQIPWSTKGRYWVTERGQEVVRATRMPADLRRFCRAEGCGRWLTPLRRESLCLRCEHRPQRLTLSDSLRNRFDKDAAVYGRDGWFEVNVEGLLSDREVWRTMKLAQVYSETTGSTLLDVAKAGESMPAHVGPLAKGFA